MTRQIKAVWVCDLSEDELEFLSLWFPSVKELIKAKDPFRVQLKLGLFFLKDKDEAFHATGTHHNLSEIFGVNRVFK
jgi:hypothetical protein